MEYQPIYDLQMDRATMVELGARWEMLLFNYVLFDSTSGFLKTGHDEITKSANNA